ncbi:hypothetical protein [Alsobacter sp. R-9]
MRSIAALLLTLALALFPLAGSRAVAAVPAHASTIAQAHDNGAPGVGHHQEADLQGQEWSSQTGIGQSDVDQNAHPQSPCGGDPSPSACCKLTCHAMGPAVSQPEKVRVMAVSRVELLALPLPTGSRFDGLLRPPRAS